MLRFAEHRIRTGHRTALVTVTGLTGSSSRPVGAMMAVAEDGGYVGSFSGGCVEAAVVAEALDALETGAARQVRYV